MPRCGTKNILGKGRGLFLPKRLLAAALGLAVVLSFMVPAGWAQSEQTSSTVIMSGGGMGGSSSALPPAGAITAQQAEAAVTKYFKPPQGAVVNANFSASLLPSLTQTWQINWFVVSDTPFSGGSSQGMFATVDAMTGRIISFNRQYPPGGLASGASVAGYTYTQALAKARKVMAELAPEVAGQVELTSEASIPGYLAYPGAYVYPFDFVRLVNGLPVWQAGQAQGVNITIDIRTGTVDSYTCNWLTGVNFPAPNPTLDVAKATDEWWNTGGLELQYNYLPPVSPAFNSGGANQVRLAYTLKGGALYVNADSGSVVDGSGQPYKAQAGLAIPPATVPTHSLPPEGLMSSKAALAWAQQVLPIPDGYKLSNVSQNQMLPGPEGNPLQMWSLNWVANGQGLEPDSISANFLAGSGQLMNYNWNGPGNSGQTAGASAFSQEQALQKAVDFLAGAAGVNPANGYRLDTVPAFIGPAGLSSDYTFSFTPTPNGIPFNMGGLYIRVSSTTGQVLSFNQALGQFLPPGGLPSPRGILSPAQAKGIFNKDITLRLGYLIPVAVSQSSTSQSPAPPVLVYGVPARFTGALIDAVTGEITNPEGDSLLQGLGPPPDVAGSWAARDIDLVLQRHLMSLDDAGLFRPQSPVTRGEAVELLLRSLDGSEFGSVSAGQADFADVTSGSPYFAAVQTGYSMGMLAKADNFYPNEPVTRQDFAVMVIRALQYDAVGRMALRISLPFKDAALVNPAEANYVALAAGLGIFKSGGDFYPTSPLTRAEAATVLVRLPVPR